MNNRYYIDTCIYLNLWQKEINPKTGLKLWKIARDFLQKIEDKENIILFSGFVLKETSYILRKSFDEKRNIFLDKSKFKKVFANPEDYEYARKLEKEFNYEISFFDCIHIVLTKKEKAILITRDEKLINYGKRYCKVNKPEELL
ncbi:MAG: PIN domain-containing protein [Nanoarchaeota archaeon]